MTCSPELYNGLESLLFFLLFFLWLGNHYWLILYFAITSWQTFQTPPAAPLIKYFRLIPAPQTPTNHFHMSKSPIKIRSSPIGVLLISYILLSKVLMTSFVSCEVSFTSPAIPLNSGIAASPIISYKKLSLVVTTAPSALNRANAMGTS